MIRLATVLKYVSLCSFGVSFLACSEASTGGDASGGAGASPGTGGAGPAGPSVVEDAEDGDTTILVRDGRSGSWYGYSEAGTVNLDATVAGHAGSGMGIGFDAVSTGWSGFGLNFKGEGGKEPYDASPYTGISFWIRADTPIALTFAVGDTVTDPAGKVCTSCHDHWAAPINVTTEWQEVVLHWSDLTRGGWGVPASEAIVLPQLISLAWNIEAPGTVNVAVDDIMLLADGVVSTNVTTMAPGSAGSAGTPNQEEQGGLAWVEGGPPTGPSPVQVYGQLTVADGKLRGANGQAAPLRGQAIGWDNWWPQYHNAEVVQWLRQDWCIDIVRPAMGIEPDGAYLQNPAASKARMRAVVDAAIEAGIYVIIDWHAHDIHQADAIEFFTEMAQAYGDKPNVIYEVFNEPEKEETWPDVKAYSEAVIAAIRVHDPDNVVIVGTPEWDQRIDLAMADPITSDPNIVYAVHFYAGTHGAWLRTRVTTALEAKIPVYVSESGGSEADGMGANDYDEWDAWFSFLEQNEVGWINWSISDKAGETVSVLRPGASANGGWGEAELSPTGVHIRSLFRSYNCP